MRYGYHLVTGCLKANQGNKSHKDVEATIIHHFNTYTNITAIKAKPFQDDRQADILLSGITNIDNPAARNWHLDVTSNVYQPYGGHQPGVDQSCCLPPAGPRGGRPPQRLAHQRKARGGAKAHQVRRHLRGNGVDFLISRSRRRVGTVPLPRRYTKQMRDSGLPADVLLGKLKKDISFALRRGTIAQVTAIHALDGYACPARAQDMQPQPVLVDVCGRRTRAIRQHSSAMMSSSPLTGGHSLLLRGPHDLITTLRSRPGRAPCASATRLEHSSVTS